MAAIGNAVEVSVASLEQPAVRPKSGVGGGTLKRTHNGVGAVCAQPVHDSFIVRATPPGHPVEHAIRGPNQAAGWPVTSRTPVVKLVEGPPVELVKPLPQHPADSVLLVPGD